MLGSQAPWRAWLWVAHIAGAYQEDQACPEQKWVLPRHICLAACLIFSPPQVLKLLLVAWDRRLIFAIGTSSTTGESDTVIWNEIHHKTEFGSNLTGHGYPDINYLDNVLAELAAQGITEESLVQEKD